MPVNAYPELPELPPERTHVAMTDVIAYMQSAPRANEVKRAAYIIFRIESANGASGVNNNYGGVQADSGRWDQKWDKVFAGTVTEAENGTGRERIFIAFHRWQDSVDFLLDRVEARGLYIGGMTHRVWSRQIISEMDLARAYHKEWVTGSAASEPNPVEIGNFQSMYSQAAALFRNGAKVAPPVPPPIAPPPDPAPSDPDNSADALMAREQAGATFPVKET